MKKFLKQTLILTVMVLCMLAIFTVATSAATYADDNAAIAGSAVARIGAAGSGTYYDSVGAAVEAVPLHSTDPTVITLIADATWNSATNLTNQAFTIQGANNNVVLTVERGTVNVKDSTSLTFDGLKIDIVEKSGASNNIFNLNGSAINIKFNNCAINAIIGGNFIRVLGVSVSADTLQFSNVTFSGKPCYLIAIGAGGQTFFGSAENPVLFENVVGEFGYMLYNKNGTNATIYFKIKDNNITITGNKSISETIDEFTGSIVCDDAFAKELGYAYRVGDEALGELDTVYFTAEEDALRAATAGVKVYKITGETPEEIDKGCEHTYVDKVVAPTCEEKGYTEHTCSKCGDTYTDTPVKANGHKYTKATCTQKSKCPGCNNERGSLAKHVDADANNKCDNCDATINAEDTTPAATEKSGCKGSVGIAGLALVAALGSCAIFVEKKRK